jgi:ribose 5-phosphate isomerase A
LHEKIVASASRCEIIIVDQSKVVMMLGRFPLPVEAIPFGWPTYVPALERLGCRAVLRLREGSTVLTDEGNYVVDCHFGKVADPERLEQELNLIPGVVDNGLFVGLVHRVFVAAESGVYELTAD